MTYRGRVLIVSPQCIKVDFGAVLRFNYRGQAKEIITFWHSQGYAEAEPMPYQLTQEGLIVERNLELFGWAVAGDVVREIYELPF
jgi:hypothetical protein